MSDQRVYFVARTDTRDASEAYYRGDFSQGVNDRWATDKRRAQLYSVHEAFSLLTQMQTEDSPAAPYSHRLVEYIW